MSNIINNTENTLTQYLGYEFQQHLVWQLLVEPEFAERIIPDLAIEYFDEPNLKRLFIIILEYYKEYDKVPNLQNQSIYQAVNSFKTPNNEIEEEALYSILKRISNWNERIINKKLLYNGDIVQKAAHQFIKQQEYRKTAEYILDRVKTGDIKHKHIINGIEERFQKISHIGEDIDDSESITDGVDKALRKEFRETIPTGIETIDVLTGGGLGKGEIGVILSPSGVGKTTFLTKIANYAYEQEKNVAQIIFEDTKDQIKRKHYTIWSNSSLSRLNEDGENERVSQIVHEKVKSMEGRGRLIIKRFSQEDTTMKDIRNWMLAYQKKWGFKFDILVLDYLDCLESHKKTPDRNEAELAIIKGFESLSADFDIPAWTAIQSNRSGFGSEFVEAYQSGGSIKRIQKAHFFMSIAKTQSQQEANFANIRIIKARFAKDGQAFEDCVFNNDTLQIIIDDPRFKYTKTYKKLKHHDGEDVDRIVKRANNMTDIHAAISKKTEAIEIIDELGDKKLNPSQINEMLRKNILNDEETKQEEPDNKRVGDVDVSEIDWNESIKTVDNSFELDSSENIVGGDFMDGGNNIKIEANDDNLLDWTGETITKSTAMDNVKMDEIPLTKEPESEEVFEVETPLPTIDNNNKFEPNKVDVENEIREIMERLENINIDSSDNLNDDFNKFLVKKREFQHVVKKE